MIIYVCLNTDSQWMFRRFTVSFPHKHVRIINDFPVVANFPLVAGFGNPQCMFICYMLIFLYAYDVFISISSSLVSWIRKAIPLKKHLFLK